MTNIELLSKIAQIISPITVIISAITALYMSLKHTRAKLRINTTLGIIMVTPGGQKVFAPFSTYNLPPVIKIDDVLLKITISNYGYCDISVSSLRVSVSKKDMCTLIPIKPTLIRAGEIWYDTLQFSQLLKELNKKQKIKWDKLKMHIYTSRKHFICKLGTKKKRVRLNKIITSPPL